MSIRALDNVAPLVAGEPTAAINAPTAPTLAPSGEVSFENILAGAVQQANATDYAANKKADALATGAIDDLHGTMISLKEADISIKLVGTVRNKILDAFQELWRTSV